MEELIDRYIKLRNQVIEAKYIYYQRPRANGRYIKGIKDSEYDKIEAEYRELHTNHFPFETNFADMVGFSDQYRECRFAIMRVTVRNMSESEYESRRKMILHSCDGYDIAMFRD